MINPKPLINVFVDTTQHPLNLVPQDKRLDANGLVENQTEAYRLATQNRADKLCTQKWSTIGDLHASSLKFLYFLLLQGIVDFKNDKKSNELYNDFYKLYIDSFNYLYPEFFDDDILPELTVTRGARVRLIGDETGDRCGNDYLMLKLIEKLIDDGANVEILISNHGLELIKAMEEVLNDSSLNNFKRSDKNYDQYGSIERLRRLIDIGLVTLDQIKTLYNKYKKTLKAFSYDYTDEGKLRIYSHAPSNELDILDIAEHLVKRKAENIMSEETYQSLHKLVNELQNHDNMLEPSEVISLVDLINQVLQYNAGKNTLISLITPHNILNAKRKADEIDGKTENAIRLGKGIDPKIYGLHYATHNRDNPNTTERSRKKNPEIECGHGHDDGQFDHCVNYDNILCKSKTNNAGTLNISMTHPSKPEPAPSAQQRTVHKRNM